MKEHTKYRALDELDRELLHELERTGNLKAATLVRHLNVGERTIRRRINNMLCDDIVKIVALPNFPLLGHRAWAAVGIRVAAGHLNSVSRQLVEHPRIYFVAIVLGRFDIIIAVDYKTPDGLIYFLTSELIGVRGIRGTEAMTLVNPTKYYNFYWPAPNLKNGKAVGEYCVDVSSATDIHELDEVDSALLSALREDGLVRPTSLKSKLGIGEGAIRKRIRNMLNHKVFQKVAVSNPEVIEYELWATVGINTNDQFSHKSVKALTEHPAVYLASYVLGRFNFIVEARFHSITLLEQFVRTELRAIKGVDSVETFLHVKHLKYNNINWYRFKSSETMDSQ